nr:SAHS [Macrobiotus sp. 3 JF-2023a]
MKAFLEIGVPIEHYGSDAKVWHKLWKEGDHFHHKISVPDKNYKNDVEFKLNEEGTSTYNGTEYKVSKF